VNYVSITAVIYLRRDLAFNAVVYAFMRFSVAFILVKFLSCEQLCCGLSEVTVRVT